MSLVLLATRPYRFGRLKYGQTIVSKLFLKDRSDHRSIESDGVLVSQYQSGATLYIVYIP